MQIRIELWTFVVSGLLVALSAACRASEEPAAPDDVSLPDRDPERAPEGSVDDSGDGATKDGGAVGEAGPDACTPTAGLRALQEVAGINETPVTPGLALTQDEKTIYFNRTGRKGIQRAKRADKNSPFGTEESFFTDEYMFNPYVSADGTKIYVDRGGGETLRIAQSDIAANGALSGWTDLPTTKPVSEPQLNEATGVLFASAPFEGTIGTLSGGTYQAIAELGVKQASGARSRHAVLSRDGRFIYFLVTDDSSGQSTQSLYFSSRKTPSEPFATPQPATGLPEAPYVPGWLSTDGCRLYLTSRIANGWKVYVANTQ